MTTASQAAGEVRDGEDGPGSGLDAVERMYDETMASIADMAVPYEESWPATEEIDVASIQPPAPVRRTTSGPAPASGLRRLWRRWFPVGWGALAAR
jgi:hypothetical protein